MKEESSNPTPFSDLDYTPSSFFSTTHDNFYSSCSANKVLSVHWSTTALIPSFRPPCTKSTLFWIQMESSCTFSSKRGTHDQIIWVRTQISSHTLVLPFGEEGFNWPLGSVERWGMFTLAVESYRSFLLTHQKYINLIY